MLILNGRTQGEIRGEYTFNCHGKSVVDCFVMSAELIASANELRVLRDSRFCHLTSHIPWDNHKSDHYPVMLDLSCTIATNTATTHVVPAHTQKDHRFRYDDTQADVYQQCLTQQLITQLVPLLTSDVDIDAAIIAVVTCMTEAANYTMHQQSQHSRTGTFPQNQLLQIAKLPEESNLQFYVALHLIKTKTMLRFHDVTNRAKKQWLEQRAAQTL